MIDRFGFGRDCIVRSCATDWTFTAFTLFGTDSDSPLSSWSDMEVVLLAPSLCASAGSFFACSCCLVRSRWNFSRVFAENSSPLFCFAGLVIYNARFWSHLGSLLQSFVAGLGWGQRASVPEFGFGMDLKRNWDRFTWQAVMRMRMKEKTRTGFGIETCFGTGLMRESCVCELGPFLDSFG